MTNKQKRREAAEKIAQACDEVARWLEWMIAHPGSSGATKNLASAIESLALAQSLAQMFLDNRLKAAFAAGWTARESLDPSSIDEKEQSGE